MTTALALFLLHQVLAMPRPEAAVVNGPSLSCLAISRPEMRGVGWPASVGVACVNLLTGELEGAILSPKGYLRCGFSSAAS